MSMLANAPTCRGIAVVVGLSLACEMLVAQSVPDEAVFRASTAAVSVDVIVQDRTGHPVLGLRAEDFDVFEDDVRQEIVTLEASGSPALDRARSDSHQDAAVASKRASAAPSVVALVFHRLSPQSRTAAVSAARRLIASLGDSEYACVFVIDLRLRALSQITRSAADLRRALDDVLKIPATGAVAGGIAESNGPPFGPVSRDAARAEEIRQRMAEGLEGPQQEAAQGAALTELIAQLTPFAGRKAIVLFSEGLAVSPRLERVVDHARAENVTVYTINAGGLKATGRTSLPRRGVDSAELTSASAGLRNGSQHGFLEMDPTGGLGPLAEHTGGFFIGDTNDLVSAASLVEADRHAYYVLVYSSTNPVSDGRYRRIDVRVRRPELRVLARKGYVAAQSTAGPNRAVPITALAMLDQIPRPHDFDFWVGAYRTPKPGQPNMLAVFVDVPGQVALFSQNVARERYAGEIAIVSRIRNGSSVLATQSQLYKLDGDLHKLKEFKQRTLSYVRTATLEAGSYQLDIAVQDIRGNRISTRELPIAVPKVENVDTVAGDLVAVQSVERAPRKIAEANPLGWKEFVLRPNVRRCFGWDTGAPLLFAISLVSRESQLTGRLTFTRGDHAVAERSVVLGQPDEKGRLLSLLEFPAGRLTPGAYDVTLAIPIISDGHRSIIRSTSVRVTNAAEACSYGMR